MEQEAEEKVEDHVIRRYTLLEKVGSGSYGHVWKVLCKRTKQVLALKKIFDAFRNVKDAQRTYRQISILRKLQPHPNLVRLKQTIKADNDRDLYLIFDYMQCDLYSVIRQNMLQQPHIRFITYQIAQSLLFLHQSQILHRDLKPANILINSDCSIKLCDFGLSRFMGVRPGEELTMTEFVATRWYRSPEIIFGSRRYSKETDLWSFGCILGEMLAGRAMFSGKTILEQIEKILAFVGCPSSQDMQSLNTEQASELFDPAKIKKIPSSYWFKDVSDQAIDLVYRLLKFNPKQRITLPEVLQHSFVRDYVGTVKIPATPRLILCDINDNQRWTVDEYRQMVYKMLDCEDRGSSQKGMMKYRSSLTVLKNRNVVGKGLEGVGGVENKENNRNSILKESRSYWLSPKESSKHALKIYTSKASLYQSPPMRSQNGSIISVKSGNHKSPRLVAINDSKKCVSIYRKIKKKKV